MVDDPTGGGGPAGPATPPVTSPDPEQVSTALSVEQAWNALMSRRAVWLPAKIQSGAAILHAVDLITGRTSR